MTRSTHVAPLVHGFEAHSSMFVSHSAPVNPAVQAHVKLFRPSVHVPPCWHGCGSQSLMFVWQKVSM